LWFGVRRAILGCGGCGKKGDAMMKKLFLSPNTEIISSNK
jgi:hypothetical protein